MKITTRSPSASCASRKRTRGGSLGAASSFLPLPRRQPRSPLLVLRHVSRALLQMPQPLDVLGPPLLVWGAFNEPAERRSRRPRTPLLPEPAAPAKELLLRKAARCGHSSGAQAPARDLTASITGNSRRNDDTNLSEPTGGCGGCGADVTLTCVFLSRHMQVCTQSSEPCP